MTLIETFQQLAKENTVLATGLSVWTLTFLSVALRKVPMRIWSFIHKQTTTSMRFDNYNNWQNRFMFNTFNQWFVSSPYFRFSRTHTLEYASLKNMFGEPVPILGPGYGLHIFFLKKKLFWFNKSVVEGNQTDRQKEVVTIYTLGRKKDFIKDIIAEVIPKEDKETSIRVYSNSKADWDLIGTIGHRSMDSVILNKDIKKKILDRVDSFANMRDWYERNGEPYKLTMLFHGEPGTGKTSLSKAIASSLGRNVYMLNLNSVFDSELPKLFGSIDAGSVMLIEDIDAHGAALDRKQLEDKSETPLSLSTLLNTLDGIVPLNDLIIIATTNHVEKLDSAFKRTGRVDLTVEIPMLRTEEVKEFARYVYGQEIDLEFGEIRGSDIHNLINIHKDNFEGFYADLEKLSTSRLKLEECAA